MTSFHTEVCSTATVWFCLTPSFSLYNRESERNRSCRPVCVVLCDRSRTGRREREGSDFADADLCVCVCRCESPGTACSSSAFPSSSSCSSSFCCRVSWWHTSNAWPTVRTILMAWDCERGWGGDTKKMVCVCVLKFWENSSRRPTRVDAQMKVHSRGENEAPEELHRKKSEYRESECMNIVHR